MYNAKKTNVMGTIKTIRVNELKGFTSSDGIKLQTILERTNIYKDIQSRYNKYRTIKTLIAEKENILLFSSNEGDFNRDDDKIVYAHEYTQLIKLLLDFIDKWFYLKNGFKTTIPIELSNYWSTIPREKQEVDTIYF